MADPGDLLALIPHPARVAAQRVRRARIRCRNPLCRRWVFVDRAVYGYGEDCAEAAGLLVRRWKLTDHGQEGPSLFTPSATFGGSPMSGVRRFLVRPDGGSVAAEGVLFTDGGAAVNQTETDKIDVYKPGTVVAGKIANGECPDKLVSRDYGDRALALEWLDAAPVDNVPAAMQPAGLRAEQADAEAEAAEAEAEAAEEAKK
jgi:hypothetical protein